MFSIIISEKGGAERRESFDKNEINVGRVQGNDLMLPKGNVSKHHARLLYRDGRFIVTDLKSTNGTYVNGRKIAQATIVREGDKIYIGDFVIRLEGQEGAAGDQPPPAMEDESIRTLARDQAPQRPPAPQPGVPAVTLKAPTHPPGAPLPKPMNAVVTNASPMRAPEQSQPAVPPQPPPQNTAAPTAVPSSDDEESSDADYRLDDMPDEGTPAPKAPPQAAQRASVAPPAEPPRPAGVSAPERPARPHTMPLQQMPSPPARPPGPRNTMPPVLAPPPPREGSAPIVNASPAGAPAAAPTVASAPAAPAREPAREAPPREPAREVPARAENNASMRDGARDTNAPPEAPPREPAREVKAPPRESTPAAQPVAMNSVQTSPPPRMNKAQAGRRLALQMLLGRISDSVDLSALGESAVVSDSVSQDLERAVKEQASAMKADGEAPEGIDLDAIAEDAHLELTQLGVVGELLEDDDVTEIHCTRFDQVLVVRGGVTQAADIAFSTDDALARVIMRLCAQSGQPAEEGESVLERRHERGSFLGVLPPTSPGSVLTFKKRRRIDDKLDDLVRQNRLNKSMSSFLEACAQGRANVLVIGAQSSSLVSAVAAIASAGNAGERVALLTDTDDVNIPNAHVTPLHIGVGQSRPAEAVRAAKKLQPARIVAVEVGGALAPLLEAIAEGTQGVIAGMTASSLRQGVSRAAAQAMLAKPGLSQDGARDLVAEAFDIAVEVASNAEGKITRIAELGGTDARGIVLRDIFSLSPEGEFGSTGVTPKLAPDLAARGVKLDAAIFKRK